MSSAGRTLSSDCWGVGRWGTASAVEIPAELLTDSLTPAAKLVAIALGALVDPDSHGQACRAKPATLARRLGISLQAVYLGLDKLELRGWVTQFRGEPAVLAALRGRGYQHPWPLVGAQAPALVVVLNWRLPGATSGGGKPC